MIDVFVVDDSPTFRALLVHILQSDPELRVVGTAGTGEEALRALETLRPHVVTMDVHMPGMGGLEATRRIMETNPLPIVIISATWNPGEVQRTFQVLAAGALAAIDKPVGPGHPDHARQARDCISTIRAMAEVKLVRRWVRPAGGPPAGPLAARLAAPSAVARVIAIGASTGGPAALQPVLAGLPADLPVPVLVVHHIAPGFLPGLVDWLAPTTRLQLAVPADGEPLRPGRVYFAPDGQHLGVDAAERVALSRDEPEHGMRPAVSYLFRSVARVFGAAAAAVLLTGMGRDGSAELKLLRDRGAVTIAQDRESSVVHGMPGEAIRLGGATYILPPERMVAVLLGAVGRP